MQEPTTQFKSSGIQELDDWARDILAAKETCMGYPVNIPESFDELNDWLKATGIDEVHLNNVGDPFAEKHYYSMNAMQFEKEVIEYFAPFYGFDSDNVWGLISHSGTDGNAHGLYFGYNFLKARSGGKTPIAYISDEAHYSNVRLTAVQNIEVRIIKSNVKGEMIPEELEKNLDTSRPCLMVYAMGSTFKGAIDNIDELNAVLAKYPEMPVYRHVDAALFGGYLPFTEHKDIVNRKIHYFDSIAISGHKFFGTKCPSGMFITTKDILAAQDENQVAYLKNDMKMINCSRHAMGAIQMWWLIKHNGKEIWTRQATEIMENTAYLMSELKKIGYPCFVNDYSNTVIIDHPGKECVKKYMLINSRDERLLSGKLSHIVVMQHVSKALIDAFVADVKQYAMQKSE